MTSINFRTLISSSASFAVVAVLYVGLTLWLGSLDGRRSW